MIKPLVKLDDLGICPEKCSCDICSGKMTKEEMLEKEAGFMKKCGFYIHYIDEPEDGFVNYHTHGISKTWGHPDFQIIIPVPTNVAYDIFWDFANLVKSGQKFKPGDQVDKIIQGLPIRLSKAADGKREVLRIIFPDKDGRFPGDPGVDSKFGKQPDVQI